MLLSNQNQDNLSNRQQSQSTDTKLWWRKVQHLLHGTKQEQVTHAQKTKTPWQLLGKGF